MKHLSSPHSFFQHGLYVILAIALLFVLMMFGSFSHTPLAHAAAPTTHAPSLATAKQCARGLASQRSGEQTSRVLFSQCVQENQPLIVPSNCVVLITVYMDTKFSGSHMSIDGCSGPCDVSGYHIDKMPGGFNDDISSFKVLNGCNITDAFTNVNETGTCQTYSGDVSFVGTTMNDKISSLRLRSQQNGTC